MCFLCFSLSSPVYGRSRKWEPLCFVSDRQLVFSLCPRYRSPADLCCTPYMPWSGLRYSLRWRARGRQRVFKALCSDVHTGCRAPSQCVGHLIVLRPVAGFLAVLLFFVSSCFLHQKWDFQHLSASSLYQSRPLWFPSPHWWMLSWRAPGKCPVCVVVGCVWVCICVCFVWGIKCMSACLCVNAVWLLNLKKRFTVKRCHY